MIPILVMSDVDFCQKGNKGQLSSRPVTVSTGVIGLRHDYQGKTVNPPKRPSNQGNPSWVLVIFRHGIQFFRGYYSRDAWTREATFSKLPAILQFCFIAEMFSALPTVFLFDRAFVSFVLVWEQTLRAMSTMAV